MIPVNYRPAFFHLHRCGYILLLGYRSKIYSNIPIETDIDMVDLNVRDRLYYLLIDENSEHTQKKIHGTVGYNRLKNQTAFPDIPH